VTVLTMNDAQILLSLGDFAFPLFVKCRVLNNYFNLATKISSVQVALFAYVLQKCYNKFSSPKAV